jgi:hypothetical protein
MAGLVDAIVTGQNLELKTATGLEDLAADANAAAIVVAVNSLLAELRANGMIKLPAE